MKWLLSIAAALVLTAPAALVAHEGHDHKVMGVVSAIHENHLEVKDVKGKVTTHTIGATTKVTRGKIKMAAADIKVGDRVVVTTRETKDKAGKAVITVTRVQLGVTATAAEKK
jgi:translation initiation factor IF-1